MLIEYKIILIILSVWIYNEDKRNKKKKKTQTIINNDNNNAIDKNADEKADEKKPSICWHSIIVILCALCSDS